MQSSRRFTGRQLTVENWSACKTSERSSISKDMAIQRFLSTASNQKKQKVDFSHFTSNMKERLYAVGKIPAVSINVEGVPSEKSNFLQVV